MYVIARDAERRFAMKIDNNQRRKVAKEMREYDVAGFKESAIVPFLECLGHGYKDWRGILDELANLIDRPTCHDIASHGGMQPAGAIQWFECSECHCKAQTDKIGMALHFCPHCGAEVVG